MACIMYYAPLSVPRLSSKAEQFYDSGEVSASSSVLRQSDTGDTRESGHRRRRCYNDPFCLVHTPSNKSSHFTLYCLLCLNASCVALFLHCRVRSERVTRSLSRTGHGRAGASRCVLSMPCISKPTYARKALLYHVINATCSIIPILSLAAGPKGRR